MPKSKVRGGKKAHNKKVKKRTDGIKAQKAKVEREFMEMIKNAQEEAQAKEVDTTEIVADEIGDIGDVDVDVDEIGGDVDIDVDVDVEM